MRKAYFSVMPFVLLLLPLFAQTAFWYPSGLFSLPVQFSAAGSSEPVDELANTPLRASLAEARKLLAAQTRLPADMVALAAEDEASGRIHLLTLDKETFLTKGAVASLNTQLGTAVELRVVRANGVNTAVSITDRSSGGQLVPLVVRYPIVRGGSVSETAYYTSAHPAIESEETARQGQAYVRRMLDGAAARLQEKGTPISPEIIDVAEHLCFVEHTDHKRFKTEDRAALFEEISTLYALNANDTYRYSVSSAGAGGMVQMIPSTYEMVKNLHPEAGLKADFVEGMRDHSNALEAMLLYMQRTWNDLARQEEVTHALDSGIATQAELLAAGYNSNPTRLAGYIKRGDAGWRGLIPSETQMYLQIYAAVDQNVPIAAR